RAPPRGFQSRGQFACGNATAVLLFQLATQWHRGSCYHNKLLGYTRVGDHPICLVEDGLLLVHCRVAVLVSVGIGPHFVRKTEWWFQLTLPALKRRRRCVLADPEPTLSLTCQLPGGP